ncbi:unnamed protein product [Choristocarpus tenellus]
MSALELSRLVNDASGCGFIPTRDLLRFLRKEKIRRPDLAVKYGTSLMQYTRKLGDELWAVHEQVLTSALDVPNLELADKCLAALQKKFPSSQRVRRLEGMRLEAGGSYEAAEGIYTSLLEENPSNSLAIKRKVAVLIAQGKTTVAVKALNGYLSDFGADAEGWLQLAKLHINASNYDAAAFCYEELVLISPSDPLVHCRLGEVYFTLGGGENLMRARKHLAQSVDLKKAGNARALHGLCQACVALVSCKSVAKLLGQGREREVNSALHLFAATELRKMYATGDPLLASAVDDMLLKQASCLSAGT